MTTRLDNAPSPAIGSRDDLVGWLAAGAKPANRWLIGTEHEKFLFQDTSLDPIPYEGRSSIRALFEALIADYGWEPVIEDGVPVALTRPNGEPGGTISLEPGGQFELSGDPLSTVHEVAAEAANHVEQVKAVGRRLGISMLGVGFSPLWTREQVPRMPKPRHVIMARYMPKVGSLGLDMMFRTCTIQVNLDFASEADMVKKLRVGLALQPVATALFAASPFTEGRPNGYKSFRGEVWRQTDAARTGNLPFAFEAGMGYERYVDYALDVPMYFIYRDGRYIDVAGASFRDFLAGGLAKSLGRPELARLTATISDWADHLTTVFPDVRLKRVLEMRGADGGRLPFISALPAFWVGMLYDSAALDAAWDLVKDWSAAERDELRALVPRGALDAPFRTGTVRGLAGAALEIARTGLERRARKNALGADECVHLAPLEAIVKSGRTVADEMIARFHGPWSGRVQPVFTEFAF